MIARTLTWFEDDDPRDLMRWAAAAAIVLGIHAAAIGGYVYVHSPDQIGDDSSPVAVDFAPIESQDDADQRDVAPAPEEMIEQKTTPDVQKQPDEPKVEEPPPPETTMSDVTLPQEKPPEKVEEQQPPAPRTAARVKGGAPNVVAPSWQTALSKHLQQFKRYPSEAREHNAVGTVQLSFTIDRTGHLLSRQIVKSSGNAILDQEGLALLERAQPFPPFPSSMMETKLELTVPLSFDLR